MVLIISPFGQLGLWAKFGVGVGARVRWNVVLGLVHMVSRLLFTKIVLC
jgi:hypothetical protein